MLNILLHGTRCTIEAQAHRGGEAEKETGGEDVNIKKKKRGCDEM